LVSTEQSLEMPAEPKIEDGMSGLDAFGIADDDEKSDQDYLDADSFFNLPDSDDQPDLDDR